MEQNVISSFNVLKVGNEKNNPPTVIQRTVKPLQRRDYLMRSQML
jgi:hypothetical protein